MSNEIVSSPNDKFTEDQQRSVMFMQWGQFIDHDLDLGLPQRIKDCSRTCDKAPPCFPIKVCGSLGLLLAPPPHPLLVKYQLHVIVDAPVMFCHVTGLGELV